MSFGFKECRLTSSGARRLREELQRSRPEGLARVARGRARLDRCGPASPGLDARRDVGDGSRQKAARDGGGQECPEGAGRSSGTRPCAQPNFGFRGFRPHQLHQHENELLRLRQVGFVRPSPSLCRGWRRAGYSTRLRRSRSTGAKLLGPLRRRRVCDLVDLGLHGVVFARGKVEELLERDWPRRRRPTRRGSRASCAPARPRRCRARR